MFYGYTDLTDVFSADNAGECCDHCHKENAKCTAFSYLSDQKICHIYYSALPGKLNRFGTISGVINPSLKLITPLNTLQNNRCIIGTKFKNHYSCFLHLTEFFNFRKWLFLWSL